MKAPFQSKGFTIVELLIVIVVIAILAAITIVSYNGITRQTRISTVKTNLRNIATQMEIFYADNGRYPNLTQPPLTEAEQILRRSGLWEATRIQDGSTLPENTFIFCRYTNSALYTVVAVRPISGSVGSSVYFASSRTGGVSEAVSVIDPSYTGGAQGAMNLCKSVDPNFSFTTDSAIWSYSIPTL